MKTTKQNWDMCPYCGELHGKMLADLKEIGRCLEDILQMMRLQQRVREQYAGEELEKPR